jgi:hypothetical protein
MTHGSSETSFRIRPCRTQGAQRRPQTAMVAPTRLKSKPILPLARTVLKTNPEVMAATKSPRASRVTASAVRRVSWMSLVAATTLGIGGVDQLRARISATEAVPEDGDLRLIVQSYRRDTLNRNQLPARTAVPLASIQRAITAEELQAGIDVSLLQLPTGEIDGESIVVAWVERGVANLEYDALEARPRDGAYYGVARQGDGNVVLSLTRA